MTTPSLAVWTAGARSGLLEGDGDYVFNYLPDTPPDRVVSLTMPVRLQSWVSRKLHPVFQMNLPEGALLDAIRSSIGKVAGVDDLTILRVTGGHQIGRNRFSTRGGDFPCGREKPESLAEILTYPDAVELFNELLARHALRSGISGVQPKVVLQAEDRATVTSASYIVKSWGKEYPQLAANEYFCMTAVRKAELPVPEFFLAEKGGLFVMKRFDLTAGGTPLGFEDMCSLQALDTDRKYASTYERVARSLREFVTPEHLGRAREQFFSTLVLSVLVGNGDAHLKNFGVLYAAPRGEVTLAPVYDVVTTTAYLRHDVPALALAGTKKWWPRKMLETFALSHLALSPATIADIIGRTAQAVAETRALIPAYIRDHPEFSEVGGAMMEIWEAGLAGMTKGRESKL